jgi:glycosyltransferase involved in cell wall biosynthesis
VLANTGTLGDLVPVLGAAPLVVYVHEQDEVLAQVARPRDIQTLVKRALRLVVSSNAVGEDLVGRRHADASSIVVLHPFAPPRAPADRVDARRELLALLGAAADTLVVGACGGLYWAKDPDAFVELAARLSEGSLASRLQFVWLGGEDPERVRLQAAVSARGLSRQVHFLPPRDDPSSFFAALDVFVLVSRSDSFGVAALEAAREGVPVVCFAGAGGLTEFVGDDAGFSVRGHDLAEMSVRVRQLAEDAALRAKLGAVGARRVLQNHTVEAVAETLLAQLREVAGGSGSRQLPG